MQVMNLFKITLSVEHRNVWNGMFGTSLKKTEAVSKTFRARWFCRASLATHMAILIFLPRNYKLATVKLLAKCSSRSVITRNPPYIKMNLNRAVHYFRWTNIGYATPSKLFQQSAQIQCEHYSTVMRNQISCWQTNCSSKYWTKLV